MPRQRAIRFPDDLHDAIEAEARRLGHPHTFSSVIVNAAKQVLDVGWPCTGDRSCAAPQHIEGCFAGPRQPATIIQRGSPSPSLARFANPETKR